MAQEDTQRAILDSARALFSARGYSAVSMRDIAAEVGIRPSSIYHHFSGKRAILDGLLAEANLVQEQFKLRFAQALSETQSIEREAFIASGKAILSEYLQNERVAPLLRILEGERERDETAAELWREMMLRAPMAHHGAVFEALMRRGAVGADDARALAAEYQSMILYAFFSEDLAMLEILLGRFYDRVFEGGRAHEGISERAGGREDFGYV